MAGYELKMPKLGESVTEGTIGKWLKQPGEKVDKYDLLVEVQTDKVNTEIPSPVAGTLKEVKVQEGETVPICPRSERRRRCASSRASRGSTSARSRGPDSADGCHERMSRISSRSVRSKSRRRGAWSRRNRRRSFSRRPRVRCRLHRSRATSSCR